MPRAPADERKMHFCAARGGSPGARGRAHDPAKRSCAQLVNLVVCRDLAQERMSPFATDGETASINALFFKHWDMKAFLDKMVICAQYFS